jgi:heat shock protein HtpX
MLSGKGIILIVIFIIIWALLFWGIGISKMLFNENDYGLLLGAAVGIILAIISVRIADSLLLKVARAKVVSMSKYNELAEAVSEYSRKYRVPIPKVYIISEMLPNFYIFGSSIEKCSFVFTRGFLDMARPQHLSAALAWAIISARRGVLQTRTLAGALSYMLMAPAKIADVISLTSGSRYNILNLILLFPLALPAALITHLASGNIDIYKIDQDTTKLTGDQGYLGVTLIEIDKKIGSFIVDTDLSLVPLFIAPPQGTNFYFRLFRTFPPLGKRINRLMQQRKRDRQA